MSSASQSHSWFGAMRSKGVAVWKKHRIIGAYVLSVLVGLGCGQVLIWLVSHETVSTYIAFVPGNMEIAGVPHGQIRMVTTRAVVEGLHQLLQDYERLCREHPEDADARKIDCVRLHNLSREPIPEN